MMTSSVQGNNAPSSKESPGYQLFFCRNLNKVDGHPRQGEHIKVHINGNLCSWCIVSDLEQISAYMFGLKDARPAGITD